MSVDDSTTTQSTIERLAAEAGPGIVGLVGRGRGGSGVVVAQGRVLTLARNLRREEVTLAFGDGRRERGRVLGVDHDLGVALVDVATGESPALSWAEDGAPTIGAPVFALADPAGRGLRVTGGAVTSSPRSLRGPRGRLLEGLIEHTAPLPRGSGGGALLDGDGRLLGVNAVRVDDGLILALPAASMQARLEDLAAGRPRSQQRRLGVAIVPPRAARRLRRAVGLPERDGVLVRGVLEGSPADRAGLERGDLIVALDGKAVESVDALFAALDAVSLEDPFNVSIVRGASERDVEVTLESQ